MILPAPRSTMRLPISRLMKNCELRFDLRITSVPVFVGMLGGRLAQNRAGVVDQDVDEGGIALHLFDERVERFAVAEVAGVAAEFAPARRDFAFERATRWSRAKRSLR